MQSIKNPKEFIKDFLPPILFRGLRNLARKLKLQMNLSDFQKRYITTIEELDCELQKVNELAKISDDELRRGLARFSYVTSLKLPKDPYSEEYRQKEMELYQEISGVNNYIASENELTSFDLDVIKDRPFPYSTLSAYTVGEQLIAQGFLIKTMNLPSHTKILEFGPGWGNTTLHFAQMGYDVTAVEINQRFAELIQYRASLINQKITLVNCDMLDFESDVEYDAVIFFECFHHCADHIKMIQKLDKLVSKEGIIVFAGEPIVDDFCKPWGLRLDGMSVWSIRNFGWLELGFKTYYFVETLNKFGWTVSKNVSQDCPWLSVFIAIRKR